MRPQTPALSHPMIYDEAIAHLDSLAQFGWKLDLARITRLCELAGHPERAFRSVLVGGSAGKGSTCTLLAGILRAGGLTVGTAPKPHLHTHRERVQVNGELISEAQFAGLMERIIPLAEQVTQEEGPPTVFEVMTLLSFLHFAECGVDMAVVEVGLGG
ncbi:MAG: folC, partial [Armatimonadetes bacterium]|nr:folC [Armatimonadota bacterium]